MKKSKAIVFAYSEMGVRCLSTLLTQDIEVVLIVTHKDKPGEEIWFDSVAELAQLNRINVITPEDPNTPSIKNQIKNIQPDWIFSFYYRMMLSDEIINAPTQGSYNMHGSLLPKYRGRSPTNWAIIKGETETGATLHKMVTKPDAGYIVDQEPVPILPNDTSAIVYQRTCFAAEKILIRTVPKLLNKTAEIIPNRIDNGSYFGGRNKNDGLIDTSNSAVEIHNLIRAVSPPYPGAFIVHSGHALKILRSYYIGESSRSANVRIYADGACLFMDCTDGQRFEICSMEVNDAPCTSAIFEKLFGRELIL